MLEFGQANKKALKGSRFRHEKKYFSIYVNVLKFNSGKYHITNSTRNLIVKVLPGNIIIKFSKVKFKPRLFPIRLIVSKQRHRQSHLRLIVSFV